MLKRVVVAVAVLMLAAGSLQAARKPVSRRGRPARRVPAVSQKEIQRTKQAIADRKKQQTRLLAEKRAKAKQERDTLAELERLDKVLETRRIEIRTLKDEIASTDAQVQSMRRRKKLTTAQIAESRGKLKACLLAWYGGDREALGTQYALRCASGEASRLENARVVKFDLGEREEKLSEYNARLREQRVALAGKEKDLASARRNREDFLRKIRREKAWQNRMLAENADAQKRLEEKVGLLITQARRAEAARLLREQARTATVVRTRPSESWAGQMAWPVAGRIIRDFGRSKHAEFNAVVYSSGIEIAAMEGTPVRAADSGRVVHSDWITGYGRVMIVDHGSGMFTLYGHLQDILVARDSEVKRGMAIGTVGSTGSLGGPSLYFEVRIRGRAVDPARYLRRPTA